MAEQLKGIIAGEPAISGTLSNVPGKTTVENNYELLKNKPKINGIELDGDRSLEELGLTDFISQQELEEVQKELEKELENIQKKFDELIDGNEVAY